jgi:iron complex outermembrane receptor protein
MKVVNLGSVGRGSPSGRLAGPFRSILGVVGLVLVASAARAQAPAPAEPEPAPAEPAPAEPAPADPSAPPPAAEAAAPETAATPEPGAEPLPEDVPMDVEPSGSLDEVVVTVDRRKKDLQDYSGTAAAFSEKQLTRIGINSVNMLSSAIPGLQIGEQEGNTEVYIRGVGNDNNSEHGDMGVAVHLDGVYLPRPRAVGAMFFDIERVEVNSGPQGTLRGRNAQGGSINIITNKPKLGEFGASAEATFGTFAERRLTGMVNIPIGDTVALRVAGYTSVHDPHWENGGPIYDIRPAQAEDAFAYRAHLKWQPVPSFSILASSDLIKERGTSYVGANFDALFRRLNDNGTPAVATDDYLDPVDPNSLDNPRRVYQIGMQPSEDTTYWGTRLEAELDVGPAIINATGSYRDLKYTQITGSNAGVVYDQYDFEGVNTDNFGGSFWDSRSQAWVGELRAFAPDTARLRWTVGGFLLVEDQQVVLAQVSDNANGYGGGEFNMPDVNGDSQAVFADATFDVTEAFRVLGGVRLTRETKSRFNGLALGLSGWGNGIRYGTEGYRPAFFDRNIYALPEGGSDLQDRVDLFLDGVGSFGARDTVAEYLCADPPAAQAGQEQIPRVAPDPAAGGRFRCTSGVNPNLADNGFAIGAVPQNSEVSNTFIDWRGGIELDFSPDNLLYGTVSTAHKAAGYNDTILRPDNSEPFNTFYDPEAVISFELGSKNVFFDRKLRLNGSFFFYLYQDQVFQQIVEISPNTSTDPNTSNARVTSVRQNSGATSNIYGLDLDMTYALPLGLQADLHVLLMDARFKDGTIVNDGRIGYDLPDGVYLVDIGGKWLPRASALTINYALSQIIFSTVGSFNWIVDAQTRTKHFMTVFNGEGNYLPPVSNVPTTSTSYQQLIEEGDPRTSCYPNCGAARLNDVVPAYTNFNLGAGWTHPDGRLSISGYVNNAFNIAYATSIISTPNLNLRFFNPPRTAGVRVRVDW